MATGRKGLLFYKASQQKYGYYIGLKLDLARVRDVFSVTQIYASTSRRCSLPNFREDCLENLLATILMISWTRRKLEEETWFLGNPLQVYSIWINLYYKGMSCNRFTLDDNSEQIREANYLLMTKGNHIYAFFVPVSIHVRYNWCRNFFLLKKCWLRVCECLLRDWPLFCLCNVGVSQLLNHIVLAHLGLEYWLLKQYHDKRLEAHQVELSTPVLCF